jgi:hypothetical protein
MDFVEWWLDRPWWLRWLIAFIPIVAGLIRLATGWFWPWAFAIGGLMVLVNLFLSWGEILDRLLPRRK